jgi:hypothetical protein
MIKRYDSWLAKLRRRSQPSGLLSQWANKLANQKGHTPEYWRSYLRSILDGETVAPPEFILDLELISAQPKEVKSNENSQQMLWDSFEG